MQLSNFEDARKMIAPYIKKTPLIRSHALEEVLGNKARVFLKCENVQVTNSFKPRGAFTVLLRLSAEEKKKGVVTRSAGNFAQGVALAGKTLGVHTTIIMPLSVPLVKKDQTASYGAKIILHGKNQLEEQQKVLEIAKEEGSIILSPYDHLDVIAGGGTISLEIYEDLPTIAYYFCPVGGGGIMAGCATCFKNVNPKIKTIAVEPLGANDYFLSRQSGQRVRNVEVHTIADGLRAPQVGDLPWPLLQKNVDEVLCVTDEEIKRAMRLLYDKHGLIIEPSGAASVAGLLLGKIPVKGDVVCVLSGANVDKERFYEWIESVTD